MKPILWQSAARSAYWALFLSWASPIRSSQGMVSANKTTGLVVLDIRTMSGLYEGETMASGNLSYFPEVNQATLSLLLVANCAAWELGFSPTQRKVMVDCGGWGGRHRMAVQGTSEAWSTAALPRRSVYQSHVSIWSRVTRLPIPTAVLKRASYTSGCSSCECTYRWMTLVLHTQKPQYAQGPCTEALPLPEKKL